MTSNLYEKLLLRENPFPRNEAEQYINQPDKLKIILFETERGTIEHIAEEIDRTNASFVVTGPWGTGKSLFLLYLYKKLVEKFGKDTIRLIYIKAPESIDDIITNILDKLNIKAKKGQKLEEKIRLIRNEINNIIKQKGKIVYVAIDQLETIVDKILDKAEETRRLAELLRSHLSTLAEYGYVLGISAIHITWAQLNKKWESLGGIQEIKLRPLRKNEVFDFIKGYLDSARLDKVDSISILEKNPYYPFTPEAIEYIAESSHGVQRNICALSHMAIEYAVRYGLDEIDIETVMLSMEPKRYTWVSLSKQYPYNFFRAIKIINELLGYYFIKSQNNDIQIIGKPTRNSIMIYDRETGRYILIVYIPQKIDMKHIKKIIMLENNTLKPIRIEDYEIKPQKIHFIIFTGRDFRYDRIISSKVSLILAKLDVDFRYNIVERDSVEVWGRLLALYYSIRKELFGYIENEREYNEEFNWFLNNIVGLIKK